MRRLLALGQRLLLGVVLVVSGAYLLIYLYRWEWNRAIISGIFFVAAEVALATAMILRRLRALEQRTASPQQPSPPVLERLRSTPVDRPDPFAWLKTHDSRVGVFVPVLLGAGAILSAFAYVVERVGEATALPALDQRLARDCRSSPRHPADCSSGHRRPRTEARLGRDPPRLAPRCWPLPPWPSWVGSASMRWSTPRRAAPTLRTGRPAPPSSCRSLSGEPPPQARPPRRSGSAAARPWGRDRRQPRLSRSAVTASNWCSSPALATWAHAV
jgi:hypothetical protein